jgi:succinate-semialdehyde dehydrogenase / glutarate-semialdehyde dehydrogenase
VTAMPDSRFFREECYINGQWVGGPDRIKVNNPATGEIIGSVPKFGRKETAAAIEAAHAAFLLWREKTANERADICRKFYQALMDHQEPLASAAAALRAIIAVGKFQGVIEPTTPTGSFVTMMRLSGQGEGMTSP